MLAGKETYRDIQQQKEWVLTPNFQKLILGYVRTGVPTRELSVNLQELSKKGKAQTFPPYFDPSTFDVREILNQLEREKLVMHVRSPSLNDDLWVITEKGSNYLNPQKKPQEITVLKASLQKQEKPRVIKTERRRRKKKSRKISLKREEQERIREQNRTLREQQRLERAKLREERRLARLKELEEEEKQRAEKRDKLENAIARAIKKLRKKRYKAHLPIFRESGGQGVQVYLSPQGKLCYKPRDTEYVIDLDVAVDVYDEQKIIRSIKDALALRGIK